MYVLAPANTVQTFPYSDGQLFRDNPQTSFPREMTDARRAEWDVFPVAAVAKPAANNGFKVAQGNPTLVANVWTQTWGQVALTAEETTADADAQRRAAIETAITGDAQLNQFKAMSNAELNSWFDANITTVNARDALMKRMFRVLVRRVL